MAVSVKQEYYCIQMSLFDHDIVRVKVSEEVKMLEEVF